MQVYYKVTPAELLSCEYWKVFKKTILKNIYELLLFKFTESAFQSWNIIILTLIWETYFMSIPATNKVNSLFHESY